MKYLIGILLALFVFSNVGVAENNFKPLPEILKNMKVETKDDSHHLMSFLSIRCGGFFGAMASITGKREIALIAANLMNSGTLAELNGGTKGSMEDTMEYISTQIMKNKEVYKQLMVDTHNATGNYYTGTPFMDGEYAVCNEFFLKAFKYIKDNGQEIIK